MTWFVVLSVWVLGSIPVALLAARRISGRTVGPLARDLAAPLVRPTPGATHDVAS